MQSIGLMVTNPVWQVNLSKNTATLAFEDVAWELCSQFPSDYIDECVNGGIDNIMNFDQLNIQRASAFCTTAGLPFRDSCMAKIGSGMRANTNDTEIIRQRCSNLGVNYSQKCLQGAGLNL